MVARPDESNLSFLVLGGSPIGAAEIAAQAGNGRCIRVSNLGFPLLTPDAGEIDAILNSARRVGQRHALSLFRFELDCKGETRTCLVWTKHKRKRAAQFAEAALLGRVTRTFVVTNPIIVATEESAEQALEQA